MIEATWVDQDRAIAYLASGEWPGRTLDDLFVERVRCRGDAPAVVDGPHRRTWAELGRDVGVAAGWLRDRGVGPGDVVAIMLPNWWESVVLHLAAARLNAVINPLHMIYRQNELAYVLAQMRPKVVAYPAVFRSTDYAGVIEDALAEAPEPFVALPVRTASDTFLAGTRVVDHEPGGLSTDVVLTLFTSGTTAAPKGVLHSHDTLLRAARHLEELLDVVPEDRILMPSPITHVAGLLYAIVVPLLTGSTVVLQDVWEQDAAIEIIVREGCTICGGATPFYRGLVDATIARGLSPDEVPLDRATCGGAGVPPQLIREAQERMGTRLSRIYGLSEGIIVTASGPYDPIEQRSGTDGAVLPGFEVRVVDLEGHDVPVGTDGELVLRGPSTFLGYLDAEHNATSFTDDGFFRSGDLVRMDEHGCIQVTGRIKDIIIRAGENISAREVEDLLVLHPRIDDVAVVGVPDDLVGERACAFVECREPGDLDLDGIVAFLREQRIAPQKLPELAFVTAELPRTGSGKVQKPVLRALALELRERGELLHSERVR